MHHVSRFSVVATKSLVSDMILIGKARLGDCWSWSGMHSVMLIHGLMLVVCAAAVDNDAAGLQSVRHVGGLRA